MVLLATMARLAAAVAWVVVMAAMAKAVASMAAVKKAVVRVAAAMVEGQTVRGMAVEVRVESTAEEKEVVRAAEKVAEGPGTVACLEMEKLVVVETAVAIPEAVARATERPEVAGRLAAPAAAQRVEATVVPLVPTLGWG